MHSRLNIPAPVGIKVKNDAERKVTKSSKDRAEARAKAYHWTRCREKLTRILRCPYRKPTQVGECKRTQARERNLSKELGKIAP